MIVTVLAPLVLGARAPSSLLPIPATDEQATASSVQPPMLIFVMEGCSGSSTTGHMLRNLIKCTSGWEDYDSENGEAFKAMNNPWFQKLQDAHPDWNKRICGGRRSGSGSTTSGQGIRPSTSTPLATPNS